LEAIEALGVCPVLGDFLSEDGVARHDTDQLAKDLLELVTQAPPASHIRTGARPSAGN
jgi:hypothetical protein